MIVTFESGPAAGKKLDMQNPQKGGVYSHPHHLEAKYEFIPEDGNTPARLLYMGPEK